MLALGSHRRAEDVRDRIARTRQWNARSAPLFCTLAGSALSTRYVQAMLQRLGEKAGTRKHVHPQGLRDAYAAELLREGADPYEIQVALGHRNPRSTDRYLQRFDSEVAEIHHLHDHRERLLQRSRTPDRGSDDVTRVLVDLLLERGISAERLIELLSRAS